MSDSTPNLFGKKAGNKKQLRTNKKDYSHLERKAPVNRTHQTFMMRKGIIDIFKNEAERRNIVSHGPLIHDILTDWIRENGDNKSLKMLEKMDQTP